jgi:hypothetical protein
MPKNAPSYFFVEVTDTYSGEANYAWVQRYKVKANTYRGAACKTPALPWRLAWDSGDMRRYDAVGAAVCAFIEPWDDDRHGAHRLTDTF